MRHALATIGLAPILLAQGRHVRRSVAVLPEPEGAREGIDGSGPPLRLLVAGDSAAAGVGVANQNDALSGRLVAGLVAAPFRVQWKLLAATGVTTADLLGQLERMAAEDFDVVVTSLGVNDVTTRCSLADWRRHQQQLMALLENKFHAHHILLSGLPPMHRFPALPQPLRWYVGRRAQDFDCALARLAAGRNRCEFVKLGYAMMDPRQMATDGFHPGPAVYALWAAELVRRIAQRTRNEVLARMP